MVFADLIGNVYKLDIHNFMRELVRKKMTDCYVDDDFKRAWSYDAIKRKVHIEMVHIQERIESGTPLIEDPIKLKPSKDTVFVRKSGQNFHLTSYSRHGKPTSLPS